MSSPLAHPITVLLTGATSGVGEALCDQLLARGHAAKVIGMCESRSQVTVSFETKDAAEG
jgi:NAD(P)-dependent dehydrogenase (short-subunit alcohol dehydrogenase family)